ncbi:hypothetical protein HY213_04420 [Candidatus Peregrinibacteria bacterium]|nr:hypothetical protein [Candidatus Peregrinibacteria bacterium]
MEGLKTVVSILYPDTAESPRAGSIHVQECIERLRQRIPALNVRQMFVFEGEEAVDFTGSSAEALEQLGMIERGENPDGLCLMTLEQAQRALEY